MRNRAEPGDARRTCDAGFTLLEVLVTLVVSGILLTMLAQGLEVGLRGWTVAQSIGAGITTLETTDLALRSLLDRASPADPLTYDRAFTGTSTGMAFTTTMPEQSGASVPHEADVSVASDGHRLVLRWRPHHARWIAPPPPLATEVLVDGVIGLQLAYFQPSRDGHGGRWLTAWSSPDLPRLVRIRLVFAAADQRHWPDIVAAIRRERPPR
jgi:prepilin-type N-terminal cleavage/methylation domain-containing protein